MDEENFSIAYSCCGCLFLVCGANSSLEVTSVKEKIAYCKIVSGGGVQKGMTVMPAR